MRNFPASRPSPWKIPLKLRTIETKDKQANQKQVELLRLARKYIQLTPAVLFLYSPEGNIYKRFLLFQSGPPCGLRSF